MNWHYSLNGARVGPVERQKVETLITEGTLNENTLVWNDTFGADWRRIGDIADFRNPNVPPPLPVSAVNDFWVWLIAFVPVMGAAIETFVTGNEVSTEGAIFGYIIANGLFSYLDTRSIKQSGRKVPASFSIGLLLVPAYLFLRAKRLGKNQTVLLVWFVSLIAAVFVPGALSEKFHFGFNMPTCSSPTSVSQIKDLFPQLPINVAKIGVLDVTNFSTLQETSTHRTCTANVVASDGNTYLVQYTIDERNYEYYYYLQLKGL